jgi:hypothetical protein
MEREPTFSHSLWTSTSASCLQFIRLSIHPSRVGMVAGSAFDVSSAGARPTSSMFVSMLARNRGLSSVATEVQQREPVTGRGVVGGEAREMQMTLSFFARARRGSLFQNWAGGRAGWWCRGRTWLAGSARGSRQSVRLPFLSRFCQIAKYRDAKLLAEGYIWIAM